jgi:hypothetical protein
LVLPGFLADCIKLASQNLIRRRFRNRFLLGGGVDEGLQGLHLVARFADGSGTSLERGQRNGIRFVLRKAAITLCNVIRHFLTVLGGVGEVARRENLGDYVAPGSVLQGRFDSRGAKGFIGKSGLGHGNLPFIF